MDSREAPLFVVGSGVASRHVIALFSVRFWVGMRLARYANPYGFSTAARLPRPLHSLETSLVLLALSMPRIAENVSRSKRVHPAALDAPTTSVAVGSLVGWLVGIGNFRIVVAVCQFATSMNVRDEDDCLLSHIRAAIDDDDNDDNDDDDCLVIGQQQKYKRNGDKSKSVL
ncbi:hypothetical protein M0804_010685 [Polistes exclamans]|nr:hypothetical protein M0804_010685 [Polistes exclamans]